MNTLHLHATDDEGWRLEIPDFPELTSLGAYRCAGDPVDGNSTCLGDIL